MRSDLCVRALHQGAMRVDVQVREHVLAMDYPAAEGRDPTPLEAVLASLAGCAANTLNLVVAMKMGAKVERLEVEARGERRKEHPTALTAIELVYEVKGEGLEAGMVERAVRIAEDQLCPVMAMLRPGVEITSSWRIL